MAFDEDGQAESVDEKVDISPLLISSWSLKYIWVTVEIRTVNIVTMSNVPRISTNPGQIFIS